MSDLRHRFTYHPPTAGQPEQYVQIRQAAYACATLIETLCPPGRESAVAFTKLEEAVMWANAAIARGGTPGRTET